MGLVHLAVRARLWAVVAPDDDVARLRTEVERYAQRIAIGGTGVALVGPVAHALGLLARRLGDLPAAVEAFTTALRLSERAGFDAFAVRDAAELARTLRGRGGPGDDVAAAELSAAALVLADRLGMDGGLVVGHDRAGGEASRGRTPAGG
jgi:hypothetical protein